MKVQVKRNKVYAPLFKDQTKYLNIYGSAGSGKSIFVTQKLLRRCLSETPHKILIIRKIANTIKDSVYAELISRIQSWKIGYKVRVNKTDKTFYFDNGNIILCKGLDEPEKMKSIEGITSTWIEEATELSEEDFDQVILRVRGIKNNYVQHILSYNPIDENHWLKRRFFDDTAWANDQITTLKTTYLDNRFIDEEYKDYLMSLKETNPLYYQVYCMGEWGVVDTSNKFLFQFNQDNHVGNHELDETIATRLSFDFNIDPFAVTIYQKPGPKTIRVVDKIRLPNSDIEQVCDQILGKFGEQHFIVTGDVSGKSRTGVVRGKRSYWQVIKHRLKLSDHQIRLRGKNLDLLESRILCNLALSNLDISIDKKLTELINDCKYAKVDDYGILVKDRKDNKNDFLDNFRYLLDAEFPDIIVKPKKYA